MESCCYDTAWRLSPQTPAAAAIPGFGAANSLLDNPTMSIARGNTYIDTIQGYLNPRLIEALILTSISVNPQITVNVTNATSVVQMMVKQLFQ